ncbi:hypothetical protein PMIN06_002302 [Paraphaeosphaeria minitans]
MSGVEVAGLVLGAFPLIITALEHYRDGFEPLHEWWTFESEFVNFIEEVKTQQDRFDNNLERLLSPFKFSDTQMNALLSQQSPEAWKGQDLQSGLMERLGRSYDSYMAICRKMNKTLRHLEKLVGIRDGASLYVAASKWNLEMHRLRVSFSKKKFKHVQLLRKYNIELKDLLSSNDKLAPFRRVRKEEHLMASLWNTRQHSQAFYTALKSRWDCTCGMSHESRIRLDVLDRDQRSTDPILHVLFMIPSIRKHVKVCTRELQKTSEQGATPKVTLPGHTLQELKNRFQQQSTVNKTLSGSSTSRAVGKGMLQSTFAMTPLQPLAVKGVMRSKKAHSQPTPSLTQSVSPVMATGSVATIQPHTDKLSRVQQMREIQNIRCSGMRDWMSDAGCFGYLAPTEAAGSPIYLYPDSEGMHPDNQLHATTLESILSSGQGEEANSRDFRMKRRLTCARTLAYAIPQFQSTSWLSSTWGKCDILFISSTTELTPTTTKLYISKTFPSDGPARSASQEDCERSLQCLGIIMLELIFKKSLESLTLRQKFFGHDGQPTEFTDHNTAKVWHSEVEGECGDSMSDVVRRCLNCSFGPQPDWNSKDFLDAYRTHVLEPFEKILEPWSKTKV